MVGPPAGSRGIRFDNTRARAAIPVKSHLRSRSFTGSPHVRTSAVIIAVTMTLCLCSCTNTASPDEGVPPLNTADLPGGTGVATVSWTPPTRNVDGTVLNDLAGYYIYYGKDPNALNGIIKVSDPFETTHTVDHLGHGTYYFKVVPFTARGVKGSATPLVSKTIP